VIWPQHKLTESEKRVGYQRLSPFSHWVTNSITDSELCARLCERKGGN